MLNGLSTPSLNQTSSTNSFLLVYSMKLPRMTLIMKYLDRLMRGSLMWMQLKCQTSSIGFNIEPNLDVIHLYPMPMTDLKVISFWGKLSSIGLASFTLIISEDYCQLWRLHPRSLFSGCVAAGPMPFVYRTKLFN